MNRHSHKGTRSKLNLLKNVPFVQMTPDELTDSFDDIGRDNTIAMLEDARAGEHQEIVIAAAVLEAPGKPDRLVMTYLEYEDGEGIHMAKDFIASVNRLKLLQPTERLRLEVYIFSRRTSHEPKQ